MYIHVNVSLRRVPATLLPWESNKYYIFRVCVCSLRYPACNAHAPYFRLWSVQLCNIFPQNVINGTIFEKEKNLLNIKYGFWFSLQICLVCTDCCVYCVLCAVQRATAHSTHTTTWNTWCHNTAKLITMCFYWLLLQKCNFSQAQCKLPGDGPSGPKHVAANIRYFNVNFNILYV
jgi:hypothetical protein